MEEIEKNSDSNNPAEKPIIKYGIPSGLTIISIVLSWITGTVWYLNVLISLAVAIFSYAFVELFFFYVNRSYELVKLIKSISETQTKEIFTKVDTINQNRNNIILNELAIIHAQLRKNASLLAEKVENRIISNASLLITKF
jgi:hypothetical protein